MAKRTMQGFIEMHKELIGTLNGEALDKVLELLFSLYYAQEALEMSKEELAKAGVEVGDDVVLAVPVGISLLALERHNAQWELQHEKALVEKLCKHPQTL